MIPADIRHRCKMALFEQWVKGQPGAPQLWFEADAATRDCVDRMTDAVLDVLKEAGMLPGDEEE